MANQSHRCQFLCVAEWGFYQHETLLRSIDVYDNNKGIVSLL